MNDEKLKEICKIGLGKDCCRYLIMSADGFQCAKFTSLRTVLDFKVWNKQMEAQGDNCEGECVE